MALSSLSAFFMPDMWFGGLTPNAAVSTSCWEQFCLAII